MLRIKKEIKVLYKTKVLDDKKWKIFQAVDNNEYAEEGIIDRK